MYKLSDFAKMAPEDMIRWIDTITDQHACDSDFGGDSDAEDGKIHELTTRIEAEGDEIDAQPGTSRTTDDFDSDDSTADPNYEPDDTPSKMTLLDRNAIIYDSDTSDDESDNEEFRVQNKRPKLSDNLLHAVKRRVFLVSDDDEEMNAPLSKIRKGEQKTEDSKLPEDAYKWNCFGSDPAVFQSSVYNTNFGSKTENVDLCSPLEIFRCLLDDEIVEKIVSESNIYAQQKNNQLQLTSEELMAYFGVLIVMGFHRLPGMKMYWSSDKNFHVPRIANTMTVKRFLKITRYIHINNNENMAQKNDPSYDRLYKVRPLISKLNEKFEEAFEPSRYLSVDECMVGFKGRSTMKQYMPLKPTKRGFKIWALACSVTGYLLKFKIYEGKSITTEEGTLGERTVLELTQHFQNQSHIIFFDNFFTSFELLSRLLSRNIFACGTFRVNRRHFPKELLENQKRMKMGDSKFAMAGDISITVWRDRGKKPVVIASNYHNPTNITTVQRTNKEGKKEEVTCPYPVHDYNKYMGGVDNFDQLREYYSISKKSCRWWMKLFYFFIDSCIVNAYIIYNENKRKRNEKPVPQITFRSILANQLIADFCSRKDRGRKSSLMNRKITKLSGRQINVESSFQIQNVGNHLPEKGTCRRCAYCSTREKPKRSTIICKQCNVALCITCFGPFHKI